MDDLRFVLSMFFMIGVPVIALPLPLVFAIQSFGRSRWAARRSFAVSLAAALTGYMVSLLYYGLSGTSDTEFSVFNRATIGALAGSGYGGLAAFLYFYVYRGNPEHTGRARGNVI